MSKIILSEAQKQHYKYSSPENKNSDNLLTHDTQNPYDYLLSVEQTDILKCFEEHLSLYFRNVVHTTCALYFKF